MVEALRGKKLLVLSGNGLNSKIVLAAKELGVYTIVIDYLAPEASPAKQIADEHWELSYADYDTIVERCRKEHVDGVLACSREATQLPYYELCRRLGYPCYATLEEFEKLANKKRFKELCREYGVGVIPDYTLQDVADKKIEFPVFVKPADNGGSKGQSICADYDELEKAIEYARSESATKDVIIEKYMGGKTSFQVTYFFVNGKAYVTRTVDGYKGEVKDGLDRVALCSISPSRYTQEFLEHANETFVRMLKGIGVKNGPVMVQGFYDDGIFRFYDPGRRFPGTDFELIYKDVFGIDLMQLMVVFALTGEMPDVSLDERSAFLKGNYAAVLFQTISAGRIGKIEGLQEVQEHPGIRHVVQKHFPGETVQWTYTTMQRIFDIDFLSRNMDELIAMIKYLQKTIRVTDDKGNDMIYRPFDTNRLKG
uniref:Putative carbamoyl-phosphate-synthetase n=1 Tax=uncultured bacterium Contig248 TaxID=1393544 RepID=W0FM40_9BACT|nr:putative carbamoyl-phosphate-synthetase [uncultured bacterium Contig248]